MKTLKFPLYLAFLLCIGSYSIYSMQNQDAPDNNAASSPNTTTQEQTNQNEADQDQPISDLPNFLTKGTILAQAIYKQIPKFHSFIGKLAPYIDVSTLATIITQIAVKNTIDRRLIVKLFQKETIAHLFDSTPNMVEEIINKSMDIQTNKSWLKNSMQVSSYKTRDRTQGFIIGLGTCIPTYFSAQALLDPSGANIWINGTLGAVSAYILYKLYNAIEVKRPLNEKERLLLKYIAPIIGYLSTTESISFDEFQKRCIPLINYMQTKAQDAAIRFAMPYIDQAASNLASYFISACNKIANSENTEAGSENNVQTTPKTTALPVETNSQVSAENNNIVYNTTAEFKASLTQRQIKVFKNIKNQQKRGSEIEQNYAAFQHHSFRALLTPAQKAFIQTYIAQQQAS